MNYRSFLSLPIMTPIKWDRDPGQLSRYGLDSQGSIPDKRKRDFFILHTVYISLESIVTILSIAMLSDGKIGSLSVRTGLAQAGQHKLVLISLHHTRSCNLIY
jgi:hypothetical protein